MKKASITEAKNNLSALIDDLKGGWRVLIVDRRRPVARLEPVTLGESDDEGRLARLLREGIVRRKPEVQLSGEVECDEVYVVAGHKGHPTAVAKKGGPAAGGG